MNHELLAEIYRDPTKTKEEKVQASIKAFRHYMYPYEHITCRGRADIFIDDILYMLGVALDPNNHRFASGFSDFKQLLIEYLTTQQHVEFNT